jgi:uncharacterized protein with gpF-like domain
MRYDLAAMTKRAKPTRRRSITFRKIVPPATLASNLYAECYAPIIAAWQRALEPVLSAYERSLSELATDSPADIGNVLTGAESELNQVVVTIRLRLERWALKVEAWHRLKWRGAVLSATEVDVGTMLGAGDMRVSMQTAIETNVGLIRSVSEQARTRIGQAVFDGLKARSPARDVAKQVREAVAMSRRRSLNIASDQLTKLSSELDRERRREAGLDTWEWVHSGKLHPREDHRARNGKRYDDKAKDGPTKPPQDLPGQLPFCGCTSRAVLSLDSEF